MKKLLSMFCSIPCIIKYEIELSNCLKYKRCSSVSWAKYQDTIQEFLTYFLCSGDI